MNTPTPAVPAPACECDLFDHAPGKPRCTEEPADTPGITTSPRLCLRCLFYCYADADGAPF